MYLNSGARSLVRMKLSQMIALCSICWAMELHSGGATNNTARAETDGIPLKETKFYREHFQELKSLAESGDANSQEMLATLYYDDTDPVEAAKWRRRAAAQGNEFSQYGLG